MNEKLELLVELVGEDEAVGILKDFIQTGVGKTTFKGFNKVVKTSDAGRSKRSLKHFSDEEKSIVEKRGRELFPEIGNWGKVSSIIAKEQGRSSTASIYNFLYRTGVVKELNNAKAQ